MLHRLRPTHGSRVARKRVARGNSGHGGTTAGRGTKGQQSRTGKGRKHGFEGGQVPLLMRQPKLGGFRSPRRIESIALNLSTLDTLPAGTYTLVDLVTRRLVPKNRSIKLLGNAGISKAITVEVNAASKPAKEAMRKAGGHVRIVRFHP